MLHYVLLDNESRIRASSQTHEMGEGTIQVDLPNNIDLSRQQDYKWVDGGLIYDPIIGQDPEQQPDPTQLQIAALENEVLQGYMAQAELYERTLQLEAENLTTMMALADIYEMMMGG